MKQIQIPRASLRKVLKFLDRCGLSVYGSVYDRKGHWRSYSCMDYSYKDIVSFAQDLNKFNGEIPFNDWMDIAGEPARDPGRPKGSRNKKRKSSWAKEIS